eukprot:GHVL01016259.1.p1 GENE.GHVL01016259.1~~GHVL01016259.1.p1  ORF type:complete len:923 (+),score=197.40 GHVL01016259.1:234-3002(+)
MLQRQKLDIIAQVDSNAELNIYPSAYFDQSRGSRYTWDYLLDEMKWLSMDFYLERRWKINSLAIEQANMIKNYWLEKALLETKKIAHKISKMMEEFWLRVVAHIEKGTKKNTPHKNNSDMHEDSLLEEKTKKEKIESPKKYSSTKTLVTPNRRIEVDDKSETLDELTNMVSKDLLESCIKMIKNMGESEEGKDDGVVNRVQKIETKIENPSVYIPIHGPFNKEGQNSVEYENARHKAIQQYIHTLESKGAIVNKKEMRPSLPSTLPNITFPLIEQEDYMGAEHIALCLLLATPQAWCPSRVSDEAVVRPSKRLKSHSGVPGGGCYPGSSHPAGVGGSWPRVLPQKLRNPPVTASQTPLKQDDWPPPWTSDEDDVLSNLLQLYGGNETPWPLISHALNSSLGVHSRRRTEGMCRERCGLPSPKPYLNTLIADFEEYLHIPPPGVANGRLVINDGSTHADKELTEASEEGHTEAFDPMCLSRLSFQVNNENGYKKLNNIGFDSVSNDETVVIPARYAKCPRSVADWQCGIGPLPINDDPPIKRRLNCTLKRASEVLSGESKNEKRIHTSEANHISKCINLVQNKASNLRQKAINHRNLHEVFKVGQLLESLGVPVAHQDVRTIDAPVHPSHIQLAEKSNSALQSMFATNSNEGIAAKLAGLVLKKRESIGLQPISSTPRKPIHGSMYSSGSRRATPTPSATSVQGSRNAISVPQNKQGFPPHAHLGRSLPGAHKSRHGGSALGEPPTAVPSVMSPPMRTNDMSMMHTPRGATPSPPTNNSTPLMHTPRGAPTPPNGPIPPMHLKGRPIHINAPHLSSSHLHHLPPPPQLTRPIMGITLPSGQTSAQRALHPYLNAQHLSSGPPPHGSSNPNIYNMSATDNRGYPPPHQAHQYPPAVNNQTTPRATDAPSIYGSIMSHQEEPRTE